MSTDNLSLCRIIGLAKREKPLSDLYIEHFFFAKRQFIISTIPFLLHEN